MKKFTKFLFVFISTIYPCLVFSQTNDATQKREKGNTYSSVLATDWMTLIINIIRRESIAPPPTLRIYVYAGLALYESQLPGMPEYQSLYSYFTGNKISYDAKESYYMPACANAAIAEVMRKLNLVKALRTIDSMELYNYSLFQKQVEEKKLKASVDYGRRVADSIFGWSKTDGTFDSYPAYKPVAGEGLWQMSQGIPNPPSGINQGDFRTFVPDIANIADPGSPPPYSIEKESEYYKGAAEIFAISKNLTHADSLFVYSWKIGPGSNYNTMTHTTKLLTEILQKEHYSLQQACIIYAKHGMAMSDVITCCFKAKFKYYVINPVVYVRNVLGQKEWNSVYLSDFYPGYPSNMAACVAASVSILESSFGKNYHFIDSTQDALYGSRSYKSFNELLEEQGKMSLLGGLHFRFSVNAATLQGRKVGALINQLPFKMNMAH